MSTKRKRRVRRLRDENPTPTNAMSWVQAKPSRLPKRVPTDIEVTALRVATLTTEIGYTRKGILNTEQDLSNLRATLANQMLEHQNATTKLGELALIPQPLT